jgi:hypothetical protein
MIPASAVARSRCAAGTTSQRRWTPATADPARGNGLVIFLITVIILLLSAVGYLLRKSRIVQPTSIATTPPREESLAPATPSELPVALKGEAMDLTALTPVEAPAGIAIPLASSGAARCAR